MAHLLRKEGKEDQGRPKREEKSRDDFKIRAYQVIEVREDEIDTKALRHERTIRIED